MLVAGIDGCPKGWIAVLATSTGHGLHFQSITVYSALDAILATPDLAAIALDIPIGLSDGPPRAADLDARRFLGRPRSSSVFPAPLRCLLDATDYVTACEASFAACGRRLSRQAFNILPKVRDADLLITPALQTRVRECHPEVSFAALNAGSAMRHNKKTAAGRAERAALLNALFDQDLSLLRIPSGAARDDFYDAAILAWTAARIARGQAVSLPAEPPRDSRGLLMQIVY
ncbi:MAG: DUF429 domain-containing protein [Dehalococcoidia bacterium]|nr:DUF429 domain-containing protein [Dehalococcoidia bacterium]